MIDGCLRTNEGGRSFFPRRVFASWGRLDRPLRATRQWRMLLVWTGGFRFDWNQALIERLSKRERVLVCGQAQSHCVQFTVRDLLEHWPPSERHRIWLLDDCMSNVPGFEAAGEAFLADMKAAGLTVVPAAEAFAEPLPLQELGANNAPMAAATAPAVAASGAG